jgi:hypothetical protein
MLEPGMTRQAEIFKRGLDMLGKTSIRDTSNGAPRSSNTRAGPTGTSRCGR